MQGTADKERRRRHVGLGQGGYDTVHRGGTLVWDNMDTIPFSAVARWSGTRWV